jgi:membrane protease YdiL (CAAX protease family)
MAKKQFLILTTFFSTGLALVALLLNRWLAGKYLRFPIDLTWQAGALALGAAVLLMAAVSLQVRFDRIFMPKILEKMRQLAPLLIELSWAERVALSVLAGLSEELLFRGSLQPLIGITAASIIFGGLHAITFGYFLLAAAMGFYLGWLLQHTNNLLVPMAVHALYDIFALNLLARIYLREKRAAETRQPQ